MNTIQTNLPKIVATLFIAVMTLGAVSTSQAHCDRVNGPVAVDARKALKTGNVDYAMIWVGEEQAQELKAAFERSLSVYNQGGESKELAERYFMSATVRLHRAAEGMPFTGLKPASPAAGDIQTAEKALKTGNVQPVTEMLSREIEKKTGELFREAMQARKSQGESVETGRKWADAYVSYIVYVHKLYQKIQAGAPHGVGE